jgi:hypothetical protein
LARFSNEINGVYDFCRNFPSLHFVQLIAQTRRNDPPYWCRMKKSLAKCIWCISYTRAGNDSGKLPGMTELGKYKCVSGTPLPVRLRINWQNDE